MSTKARAKYAVEQHVDGGTYDTHTLETHVLYAVAAGAQSYYYCQQARSFGRLSPVLSTVWLWLLFLYFFFNTV